MTANAPPPDVHSVVQTLLDPDCAATGEIAVSGLRISYTRPRQLAYTIELLLQQQLYDVALPASPRIIDGGSWLGLSLLLFRRQHPGAVLTGYEPDPEIYELCRHNLDVNGASDIEVVRAAMSSQSGTAGFAATGSDNGSVVASLRGARRTEVRTVDAREALGDGADLIKLNIEGSEAEVIERLGKDGLERVGSTLIEYHGFNELPQSLHRILATLHDAGHRYLVSHVNHHNQACVPPFEVTEALRFFSLVHSRRLA